MTVENKRHIFFDYLNKLHIFAIANQIIYSLKKLRQTMVKYVCEVCGWEYDPEVGVPEAGIEPGTAFEDLPEDFECPLCGVGKDEFAPAE